MGRAPSLRPVAGVGLVGDEVQLALLLALEEVGEQDLLAHLPLLSSHGEVGDEVRSARLLLLSLLAEVGPAPLPVVDRLL